MDDEKYKGYLGDCMSLLKEQAREARQAAEKPEKGSEEFNEGELDTYYRVISTLKNRARIFGLTQEGIGLADINPDEDLLTVRAKIDLDHKNENS